MAKMLAHVSKLWYDSTCTKAINTQNKHALQKYTHKLNTQEDDYPGSQDSIVLPQGSRRGTQFCRDTKVAFKVVTGFFT